jgi:hypothetical protein
MDVRIKRVYEPPAPDDGFRVLVDRLWPRGLSKERAAIDLWEKDVAPSDALRTAFHHGGLPWPISPTTTAPSSPARRRSTSCVAPSRTHDDNPPVRRP